MYCERCGSFIPEDQKFCGQCGAPAPAQAAGAAQVHAPAPAAAPAPVQDVSTGSRFNSRTCLVLALGCLGIVLIGACLAAALVLPVGRGLYENLRARIGWDGLQPGGEVIIQPQPEAVQPAELATATVSVPDFCAEQICFDFPAGVGFTATASTEPEQLEPEFWANPEYLNITFSGYPLSEKRFEPHLSVYDTASFRAVNPNAVDRLDELQSLLATRPAAPSSVPLVPVFNAAQMITAAVEYIDFDGGSGVRFITQYGQAVWPINNNDVFYAFSALSDDGSLLITAIMPVANQALPDDPTELMGDDIQSFEQGYEDYLAATEAMLNTAPPASYTPDLDLLDGMMGSIRLTP